MKHSFNIKLHEEFIKAQETKGSFVKFLTKNNVDFDSLEEMFEMLNNTQKDFFISQLKVINMLNRDEYNKLLSMDVTTRNGLNYKTITQIGNYRFTQLICINSDNVLTRRYFVLDFNNIIAVDGVEYTNDIYEIDVISFSILISEICSAKQDIENNLDIDDANRYLSHMESLIKRFIDKHHELTELNRELDKDF